MAAAVDALTAVLPAVLASFESGKSTSRLVRPAPSRPGDALAHLHAASISLRCSRALAALAHAARDPSAPVNAAIFGCCRQMLRRGSQQAGRLLDASGHSSSAATDALATLQHLLFARRDIIFPESVRLRRAEAILALAQASIGHEPVAPASAPLSPPSPRGLPDLARHVQSVVGLEKSTQVRAILLQALALLQSPSPAAP